MTSSWFFLSTLNYDARSATHQILFYVVLTASVASAVLFFGGEAVLVSVQMAVAVDLMQDSVDEQFI